MTAVQTVTGSGFAPKNEVHTLHGVLILWAVFLPAECATVNRLKRTGRSVIDGGDYLWQVFFDDG